MPLSEPPKGQVQVDSEPLATFFCRKTWQKELRQPMNCKDGTNSGRHWNTTAKRVRYTLTRNPGRVFKVGDFRGLSPSAVSSTLYRLAKSGEAQRVGKGMYVVPKHTILGPLVPGRDAVAAYLAGSDARPAGPAAANLLRLSTQLPGRTTLATSRKSPTRQAPGAKLFIRRPQINLPKEELALLEVLRDRAYWSELSPKETCARLAAFLTGKARFRRVAKAALAEPPRVRAIMGALGQEAGHDPRSLRLLRDSLNPLSRFDFGALRTLPSAKEWQAK